MGKKRILFITNRNIINTCGELRLIKNRAEALYNSYGYVTDFIAFTNKETTKSEPINVDGKLIPVHYSLSNPVSVIKAKRRFKGLILKQFQECDYSIVIISGADLLPLVDWIKETVPQMVTIADCHGAYEELLEFNHSSKLKTIMRHQIFRVWKQKEKKKLPFFDHIMAVSEGLKRYLIREYSVKADKVHVIPCAIKKENFSQSQLAEYRNRARDKYGIKNDETLFVYSGGTSKWQCIDEIVEIFGKIRKRLPNTKLLLLSGDWEYISRFRSKNIIIDSLKADEVIKTLPGADFAFLLRGDYVTNRVAYPNKFLEYVSSGVKIIATPFVEDVADAIQKYELGYVMQSTEYEEQLIEYILRCLGHGMDDMDARKMLLQDVSFEKRLEFFNKV